MKDSSCLHSSLLLQESMATSLECNNTCFVVLYDVAKAFDSVWTNGLFYELCRIGIPVIGWTWRILFKKFYGLQVSI